jgi:hypothetical protein
MDGITRSLKHHRWPFDIRQELVFSALAASMTGSDVTVNLPKPSNNNTDEKDINSIYAIVTYYEACWISDYSVSYASDTAMVQETVTINVSDILAGPGKLPSANEPEPYSILGTSPAKSRRFTNQL